MQLEGLVGLRGEHVEEQLGTVVREVEQEAGCARGRSEGND